MTADDVRQMEAALERIHGPIKPYKPQRRGYVYFIQDGEHGDIKIGWSVDPDRRLRDLRVAHATRSRLRLLAAIPGHRKLERELHERFAPCRGEGEWFAPVPELLAFLKSPGRKL